MTPASASILLAALLAIGLCVAAATDIRARIIPDSLNIAIALAAPAWWWATGLSPWPDMAIQLGLGAAVFAVFVLVFRFGMMGGGDVKLLGALALWLPLGPLLDMLMLMAVMGGLLSLVMLIAKRVRRSVEEPEVPYGVAIAAAALWVVGVRYLNQFA